MGKFVAAEVQLRERVIVAPAGLAKSRAGRLDIICLLLLFGVTSFAGWRLLHDGMYVGQDAATQFYPWYSYLGERG